MTPPVAAVPLYHLWVGLLFLTVTALCFLIVRVNFGLHRMRAELDRQQWPIDEIPARLAGAFTRYFRPPFYVAIACTGMLTILTILLMTLAPKTSVVIGPLLIIVILIHLRIDTALTRLRQESEEIVRIYILARKNLTRIKS